MRTLKEIQENLNEFAGTKTVGAVPMTRGEYNELRKWDLPADENKDDEGYLIYEPDAEPNCEGFESYITWTTKEIFEKTFRGARELPFSSALHIAETTGKRIARSSWTENGLEDEEVNQWVCIAEGTDSLPADKFWNRNSRAFAEKNGGSAPVLSYLILKTPKDAISMGWSPSQEDTLAKDWLVLEDNPATICDKNTEGDTNE